MLIAYTLEILPFNIRAKGFAVMVRPTASQAPGRPHSPDPTFVQNLVVSLTLAFNPFVNPWALDAIGWKYVRALPDHACIGRSPPADLCSISSIAAGS